MYVSKLDAVCDLYVNIHGNFLFLVQSRLQ